MQVQKQELVTDVEQQTGSKSGKEYLKAEYDHLTYLTCMKSTSGIKQGWKHKLESRLQGEISINSGMQMTPILWQKVKSNWLKEDLVENERGEFQKTKTVIFGPITS